MFTGDIGAPGPQTTVCMSVPPDEVCKLSWEIVTVAGFVSHALSVTATQLCLGRAEIAASNLSMKGCKLCSNKTLLTNHRL